MMCEIVREPVPWKREGKVRALCASVSANTQTTLPWSRKDATQRHVSETRGMHGWLGNYSQFAMGRLLC